MTFMSPAEVTSTTDVSQTYSVYVHRAKPRGSFRNDKHFATSHTASRADASVAFEQYFSLMKPPGSSDPAAGRLAR